MAEIIKDVSFTDWGVKITQFLVEVGGIQYRAAEIRVNPQYGAMLFLDGITNGYESPWNWLAESLDAFHEAQRLALAEYREERGG